MSAVFISYVSEDRPMVGYIVRLLRANGVKVWFDQDSLPAGRRWKDCIREGIERGSFYVPFFSRAWEARETSFANDELTTAIEQLRLRPANRAWFIPVKLDECKLPDRAIGGGERLGDLQRVDFVARGWAAAMTSLFTALGVSSPAFDVDPPLAAGWGARALINKGIMHVEKSQPPALEAIGRVHTFTGGWVARRGDKLLAFMETQAPDVAYQAFNVAMRLDRFFAETTDSSLSIDASRPTVFRYTTQHVIPAGTEVPDLASRATVTLPFPLQAHVTFEASGSLEGNTFSGKFNATHALQVLGRSVPCSSSGLFTIHLRPTIEPIELGEARDS